MMLKRKVISTLEKVSSNRQPYIARFIECSNDVEKNPGPQKLAKNQIISKFKNKKMASSSNEVSVKEDLQKIRLLLEEHNNSLKDQRHEMEAIKKRMDSQNSITLDFQSELSEIRKNWQNLNGSSNPDGKDIRDLNSKVESLSSLLNDIHDRLHELDKSWKNNLILFGVPCGDDEEDPMVTLDKVREILHKKLYISRDIPMSRISRINYGPDFRGHRPIQLCLVNYRDKEELLRKSRLLKGTNIYLSEDFSRKVREHRHELVKFMKEVRTRDPARRMTLRYDKLYMGHDVFFFNDRTNRVEKMQTSLENAGNATFTASLGNLIINDSQASLQQDLNWLRRPRSRAASRSATPLSTSVSMEDFSDNLPPITPNRTPVSARPRLSGKKSPTKSSHVTVEKEKEYNKVETRSGDESNQEERDNISKKSPKTVVFKDVPAKDKETPRMINGTPHHNPFPRSEPEAASEEEIISVVMREESLPKNSPNDTLEDPKPITDIVPYLREDERTLPPIESSGIVSLLDSPIRLATPGISNVFNCGDNDGVIFPTIPSSKTVLPFETGNPLERRHNPLAINKKPFSKFGQDTNFFCKCGKKQIEIGRPNTGRIKQSCSCSSSQDSGIIKVAMFGEFSMSGLQPKSKENNTCNFAN